MSSQKCFFGYLIARGTYEIKGAKVHNGQEEQEVIVTGGTDTEWFALCCSDRTVLGWAPHASIRRVCDVEGDEGVFGCETKHEFDYALGQIYRGHAVLPRWSPLRGVIPAHLTRKIALPAGGDIVVIGAPSLNEVTNLIRYCDATTNVYLIGREYTKKMLVTSPEARALWGSSEVSCQFLQVPTRDFLGELYACPGFDVGRVACIVVCLNRIHECFLERFTVLASQVRLDCLFDVSGPVHGANPSACDEQSFERAVFGRKPGGLRAYIGCSEPGKSHFVVPTCGPIGASALPSNTYLPPIEIDGMPLSEILETDFSSYVLGRTPATDGEWYGAAQKMLKGGAFTSPGVQTLPNGQTITAHGPDWASRHAPNWGAWMAAAHASGADMQTFVVVGVFEGLSVNLWDILYRAGGGPGDPIIYCVDPGRTLQGAWGFPRVAHMQDNLPTYVRPLIGQSGVVLPLLAARMAYEDRFASVVEIDGSHHCDDVLLDCEYAWRMLATGGIMVCDDYSELGGQEFEAIDSTYVYTATRGIHAFMHLHRGQYRVLPSVSNQAQICLQKVVQARHMFGTAATPYDFDGEWQADKAAGQLNRKGRLPRPALPGLVPVTGLDAETAWYGAEQSGDFDVATCASTGKALVQGLAGGLKLTDRVATNIGGGLEVVGEGLGGGHPNAAVRGFGNMFKSFGRAAGAVGYGAGLGALKVAEAFVPRENRWW